MKRIRKAIMIFVICILINIPALAQEPYPSTQSNTTSNPEVPTPILYNTLYASAYTDLWSINPYTGETSLIGPIGYEGTDIAFDGTTLYGCNFSQLLLLDPTTGNGSVIGNIGYSDVNALTVGFDGTMYAGTISGAFLRIDKSTGAGTLIGYYGSEFGSSGDLAIRYDNVMFATVRRIGYANDWLVQIDVNTGRAIPIGDIGEYGVFGLDFKDWRLYGVTTDGYILEINPDSGHSIRINTEAANFWGLSTSGPALQGSITAPPDNYTTGPASISISAIAEYPGGQSVNQVEFYVRYSGNWHSLGIDTQPEYQSSWEMPLNIFSQQASLRIDVIGTDNQNKLQRASYAGGIRRINIIDSYGDPNIIENWVPIRAYLNQRSLPLYIDIYGESHSGDEQCNVSSIAMILAMDGNINPDYQSMANKAHSLASYLLPNPGPRKECEALQSTNPSAYCSGAISQEAAWPLIKQSIDNGHPVIIDSRPYIMTEKGHYLVAIGYREQYGQKSIIAYDPYGEWQNKMNSYYRNITEPASHVGKWVYYEYEKFTDVNEVYLFATVLPTGTTNGAQQFLVSPDATLLTPPDQVSDEMRVHVIFNGESTIYPVFIPTVNR
jgi:hypothetical protein